MTKRSKPPRRPGRKRVHHLATGADVPPQVRRKLVDEVRRRLQAGELDSPLARMETALALLDGDT